MDVNALLCLAILSSLGGIGFAGLVAASPMGRWPFKPFSCQVCLSAWGAILTLGLLAPWGAAPWEVVLFSWGIAPWAGLSLAGAGGAQGILALLSRSNPRPLLPGETPPPLLTPETGYPQ